MRIIRFTDERPDLAEIRAGSLRPGDVLWPTNRQVMMSQQVGRHVDLRLVRVDSLAPAVPATFLADTLVAITLASRMPAAPKPAIVFECLECGQSWGFDANPDEYAFGHDCEC